MFKNSDSGRINVSRFVEELEEEDEVHDISQELIW